MVKNMARYYHHRNESEDEQRHVPVDSECDAPGQTAYGDDADGKPDDTADGNALFFNQQPLGYLGEEQWQSVCKRAWLPSN